MFHFHNKADNQLQNDVMNEIRWDPSITATEIKTVAKDGYVTLSGTVPHYTEKANAEKAAQRVSGVKAVADEISVNMMGLFAQSDGDIAAAAVDAIKWNYQASADVKVTVDRAWITLRGEANWDYQRHAATDAVRNLLGVRGVTNEMIIKSSIIPSDVKILIEQAFIRSAEKDGNRIDVSVEDNVVTLKGNVASFAEIDNAAKTAWNAPGVMQVNNELKLSH